MTLQRTRITALTHAAATLDAARDDDPPTAPDEDVVRAQTLVWVSPPGHPVGQRIKLLADSDFDLRYIDSVAEARAFASIAWCVILAAPSPGREILYRLAQLRNECPFVPRILVVSHGDPMSKPPSMADVSLLGTGIERRLAASIWEARCVGIRALVRSAAERSRTLTALSKRAVRVATRESAPVIRVGELAQLLHCGRSTLWQAWHPTQHLGGGRLEDFLDWLLLVHAVSWKRGMGAGWEDVASRLRVDPATVRRIAKRQLGLGLGDVVSTAHSLLATPAVVAALAGHFGKALVNELPAS